MHVAGLIIMVAGIVDLIIRFVLGNDPLLSQDAADVAAVCDLARAGLDTVGVCQGFHTVRDRRHLITLQGEGPLQGVADGAVVFGEQHSLGHLPSLPRPPAVLPW